ncbi:MAG: T9SS type A sorting domain-containing protein, partial [Bacteroidota bacterium]
PTAVCRESLIAQIDSEGNLALTPDSLDAGSFDDHTASEDLILSFDTSNDLPGCADVAMPAQSVGLVVTNEAGLTDTCFTLVTVRDTIPPVLICRDVTVDVSLGVFDLAVSGAIDGSRDNCTAFAALSSSFPIGCNLVGDNALNLDVQDSYGNVSSCAFILNVTDTTFLCTDAPLSVAWLSFGADAGAKQVELRWEITEEPDNAGFHVERSATGNDWVSIGTVPAHRKFSQRYAFTDSAPLVGNNYYRLRQTDFSGEITYSSVEIVTYRDGASITLYPNPATETINLRLPASAELVGLFNVTGQRSEVRFSGQDGQLQAEISGLPSGLYFARVRLADGHLVTRRLIVNTK